MIGTAAPDKSRRYAFGRAFELLCLLAIIDRHARAGRSCSSTSCVRGLGTLNWSFLTSFPSRFPDQAGILAALVGTIWLLVLTALFALPTGVAAAV